MTSEIPSAGTQSASRSPSIVGGELPPGTILDEQFEIESLIGRGGMAVVYRAKDLRMDRIVAIKMLAHRLLSDDGALKRFQREAVAVATLSHPNIINVFGLGKYQDQPYVIMELLEGTTLADLIQDNANLTLEYKIGLFLQILDALSYAHSKGVIHRDLKPRNIMLVNANSTVKLLDFGIAKILPQSGKQLQTLTQAGELFGTVSYMSPEQCRGESLDARSDIYSMGCLMYEVLSGHPPFDGASAYALLAKHLDKKITEPPCQDRALSRVVLSALAKDPDNRPQSADELANALRHPETFTPPIPVRHSSFPLNRTHTIIGCCLLIGAAFMFKTVLNRPAIVDRAAQESANLGKAHEILERAQELWDEGRWNNQRPYRQGAQLLVDNQKYFPKGSPFRKAYLYRLTALSMNAGYAPTAEAAARELIGMMEQEKNRRQGRIEFSNEYATALSDLPQVLLSENPPRADEALKYARQLCDYVHATATPKQEFNSTGCFDGVSVAFARAGLEKESKEFHNLSLQILKRYRDGQ